MLLCDAKLKAEFRIMFQIYQNVFAKPKQQRHSRVHADVY